ncbi:MAG TPA: hypothetical protein PKA05_11195 [Roseiflexaceae bacterium]|nr:hypothetical protein [Roseiflexaceae bacterium]HMP40938.1 hypothetical protein [Roseiflexaceae bacterium]
MPKQLERARGMTVSTTDAHGHSIASGVAGSILQQLAVSLDVLGRAAEYCRAPQQSGQTLVQLQSLLTPHARQAEAALRRLRELRLTSDPAATELIQCLTVLVLAADMIVQGQLVGIQARETCDLLERNASRALASLRELRIHL